MAGKLRNTPLLIVLLLAVVAGLVLWKLPSSPPPTPPGSRHLADLGSNPDWSRLDPYQNAIIKSEFLELMEEVYTIGSSWKQFIKIGEHSATITTQPGQAPYELNFATETSTPPRFWRPAAALDPAPADRPLQGLHIAIDPGHIGGDYAKMEARWFQVDPSQSPVMEGEMTLLTAQHLRLRLQKLGAQVSLVRSSNAPVTEKRAKDFEQFAREQLGKTAPAEQRATAERLFYRTSEIRARAKAVNELLRPDLVLCLHFNAEGWGDPASPRLSPRNHFHIILNGAYTPNEVAHDDERLELLLKIAQQIYPEEKALAQDMAGAFKEITALPPYHYKPLSKRAIKLDDSSYLWARNLLANRLYECPVLFLEPYVMNSTEVHARAQAGDYEGLRDIAGVKRQSIYREYAEAVALGLERYYRSHRAP